MYTIETTPKQMYSSSSVVHQIQKLPSDLSEIKEYHNCRMTCLGSHVCYSKMTSRLMHCLQDNSNTMIGIFVL